jgi:hypothetical protein
VCERTDEGSNRPFVDRALRKFFAEQTASVRLAKKI